MDDNPTNFDLSDADEALFLARIEQYLNDGLSPIELEVFQNELVQSAKKQKMFMLVCLGRSFTSRRFSSTRTPGDHAAPTLFPQEESGRREASSDLGETMIQPAVRSPAGDESEIVKAPQWAEPRKLQKKRRFISPAAGIAAALLISTAIAALFLLRAKAPTKIASIACMVNARWESGSSMKANGPLVTGQSIGLSSGYVELLFLNQTKVIVEGPARLQLESPDSIELLHGKVTVQMAAGTSGFAVATPRAKVTDLGTEFGVMFTPTTNVTDVHVFKGLVGVTPNQPGKSAPSVKVTAGDAAEVAASGAMNVVPHGAQPQLFVLDLVQKFDALELADLLSGGNGLQGLRGGVVDQSNGVTSTIKATGIGGDFRGDGKYHLAPGLPILDGTFVPGQSGTPMQIDSAGNRFAFPPTKARSTVKIAAGGTLPEPRSGNVIYALLGGIDYTQPGHSFLYVHPSAGLTFDLDAIRKLHPDRTIMRFRCVVGDPQREPSGNLSSAFVLVDGKPRFSNLKIASTDAPLFVDIPISPSDRFLTLASTSADADVVGHQIIFGDPKLSLLP